MTFRKFASPHQTSLYLCRFFKGECVYLFKHTNICNYLQATQIFVTVNLHPYNFLAFLVFFNPPIYLNSVSIHIFIIPFTSASVYTCLSVCASAYPYVYLAIHLSIFLIYLSIYLTIYLSVQPYIQQSIYLTTYLSIHHSNYLTTYLFIYVCEGRENRWK